MSLVSFSISFDSHLLFSFFCTCLLFILFPFGVRFVILFLLSHISFSVFLHSCVSSSRYLFTTYGARLR